MLATLRPLAALLIAVALMVAGGGLLNTVIALRAGHEGFPNWVIGLFLSAFSAAYIAGCLFWPYWIRAVGHIRVFAALMAISAAATILLMLIVDPIAWTLLRAVFGFCAAGIQMIIESWMNERAQNANRGRLLSVYRIVDLGCVTLAQLFLLFMDPLGHELFSLIAVFTVLAIVPVALTTSPVPRPIVDVRVDIPGLYRVSPFAVVACLGVGISNSAFWSLSPVYALAHGFTTETVAWFMTVVIIGGALSQYPLGQISDKIDRRIVIAVIAGLAALASLGLAAFGNQGATLLLILAFAFGLFGIPIYALAAAHANDSANGEFVKVSSGLLIVYSAGAIIGPLIAGALMDRVATEMLFVHAALFQLSIALFGIYRMRRRAPPAAHADAMAMSVPIGTRPVFQIEPEGERPPAA